MEKFSCVGCGECCKSFGKGYLPLFEKEYLKIKKISEKNKIILKLKPVEIFKDEISEKYFCFMYGIFNEPCVFLKDNKCSIYSKRPLICRQFPIFSIEKYSNEEIPEFMECINFKMKEGKIKEIYPESYRWCEKSNKESYRMAKKIINLEKKGKVRVVPVQDFIGNVLSFSEFVEEVG
jgi:Fe-S-cluster containining protein